MVTAVVVRMPGLLEGGGQLPEDERFEQPPVGHHQTHSARHLRAQMIEEAVRGAREACREWVVLQRRRGPRDTPGGGPARRFPGRAARVAGGDLHIQVSLIHDPDHCDRAGHAHYDPVGDRPTLIQHQLRAYPARPQQRRDLRRPLYPSDFLVRSEGEVHRPSGAEPARQQGFHCIQDPRHADLVVQRAEDAGDGLLLFRSWEGDSKPSLIGEAEIGGHVR